MSIVGEAHPVGKVDRALSHAGGDVITVPAELVRVAVIEMATVLVPRT